MNRNQNIATLIDKLVAEKIVYHKNCFRCEVCKKCLTLGISCLVYFCNLNKKIKNEPINIM